MNNEKGSALIITLLILTFLSALAVQLAYYLNQNNRLVLLHQERQESLLIAKAIFWKVLTEIESDKSANDYDNDQEPWVSKYSSSNGKPRLYDYRDLDGKLRGSYSVAISDEGGKLNLNNIDDVTLRAFLEKFQKINSERASREIIAYRNRKGQSKKYDSVLELLKIKDIDQEIILGDDTNENGILDNNENDGKRTFPDDNFNGKIDPGLKDSFTIFSDGRINVNTASEDILLSMSGMTEQIVDDFLKKRDLNPVLNLEEFKDIAGVNNDVMSQIKKWGSVQSQWFKVSVSAQASDADQVRQIVAVVDRSTIPARVRYWREN